MYAALLFSKFVRFGIVFIFAFYVDKTIHFEYLRFLQIKTNYPDFDFCVILCLL